jgi:hypothetical protein
MSTCWKCGQATPEGVVECEDGCQPQALRELMALADKPEPICFMDSAQPLLCLNIRLYLDPAKVAADPAAHRAATLYFSELLGHAIVGSGLIDFLKRNDR